MCIAQCALSVCPSNSVSYALVEWMGAIVKSLKIHVLWQQFKPHIMRIRGFAFMRYINLRLIDWLIVVTEFWIACHFSISSTCVHWLLRNVNYVHECCNRCDIIDCIRMTWWVPAAVPQVMKLMKHTSIWSLLLCQRLSTWLSKHVSCLVASELSTCDTQGQWWT